MPFFTKLISFISLLSALPAVARAETTRYFPPPRSDAESTVKAPGVPPLHLGPMKVGTQFVKRPRVDSQSTIKDVGFGLKFSFAI